jgi:hypothetical protein
VYVLTADAMCGKRYYGSDAVGSSNAHFLLLVVIVAVTTFD